MDLVARVARRDGSTTLVIVLVELQARPEQEFPWRLFEYYTLLRRVHRLPVLPIVIYVRGGRGSELWEEYREGLFEEVTVLFRYHRLRLNGRGSCPYPLIPVSTMLFTNCFWAKKKTRMIGSSTSVEAAINRCM